MPILRLYSEPFGVKTDEFHLCFTCHMMVHCRHRNEAAWIDYIMLIEMGGRFEPYLKRNWFGLKARFLDNQVIKAMKPLKKIF